MGITRTQVDTTYYLSQLMINHISMTLSLEWGSSQHSRACGNHAYVNPLGLMLLKGGDFIVLHRGIMTYKAL